MAERIKNNSTALANVNFGYNSIEELSKRIQQHYYFCLSNDEANPVDLNKLLDSGFYDVWSEKTINHPVMEDDTTNYWFVLVFACRWVTLQLAFPWLYSGTIGRKWYYRISGVDKNASSRIFNNIWIQI